MRALTEAMNGFLAYYLRLRADRGGPYGGLPSLRRLRLDYTSYLGSAGIERAGRPGPERPRRGSGPVSASAA